MHDSPQTAQAPALTAAIARALGIAAAVIALGALALDALTVTLDPEPARLARELGATALSALIVGVSAALLVAGVRAGGRQGSPVGLGTWLLTIRWVAWFSFGALTAQIALIDPRLSDLGGGVLVTLLAALALFNLALTRRGPDLATTSPAVTAQTVFDTAALVVALHVTGGITNPFSTLFVFHAVIAALFLPASRARLAIAGVSGGAVLLTVSELSGALGPLCLGPNPRGCATPDGLTVTATGLVVTIVTLGAGLVVHRLTTRWLSERDNLRAIDARRSQEAAELLRASHALREERGRLDAILDCIADAVVVASTDGRIVLRNRASAALWPNRHLDAVDDLRVCHDPATWDELFRRLSTPRPLETHPVLRVGERLYEATWGRVTCRDDGRLLGAVMVARDITARAREQAIAEQRERMATLGTLSASLAHEINNPLSSIQLYTQHALKSLGGAQPLTGHLETVQRNADACTRIVRDLLEYARQRVPDRRPIQAGSLMQLAINTVRPLARTRGVSIRVLDEGLGTLIDADRDQLVQVLVNLAMNAIEAMSRLPDDAPRTLTFSCHRREDEIHLSVTDTGPGVPLADHEHIFSPFFTTREDGTGLGLAVSRDIIRAHEGRITLSSPAGQGATFTIALPAADRRGRATAVVQPPSHPTEEPT